MSKSYIHKKTGDRYFVTREAINSTNANDGQVMIVYTKDHKTFFVREKSEFYEKFEEEQSASMKKYQKILEKIISPSTLINLPLAFLCINIFFYFFFLIYKILFITKLKAFIIFVNDNIYGSVILFVGLYLLWTAWHNYITKIFFQMERYNNCKAFSTKRREDEGKIIKDDKNRSRRDGRDNIYLVKQIEGNLIYHRVVNPFTRKELGYPRPLDDDCFTYTEQYVLGDEIKIYNIISDIKEIIKLKD